MKHFVTTGRLAAAVALTLTVASTGCQSSGGSRWAWNPWKKSAGEEAAALAASEAPKLPSDDATPMVEGLPEAKPQPTMVAETKPQTPPAMAGIASTIEAVNAAVPTIDKPAPTSPNFASVPETTPTPPPTAVASMPYDPNGYKPKNESPSIVPTSKDRYGLGDRYAASTPPAANTPSFGDLPPVPPTPSTTGDRYGLGAPQSQVAAATSTVKDAANEFGSKTQATANNAIASVGSRYGATTPAPAATVAQATSVPASPAAPAPAYPTTPSYPTTKSFASATPADPPTPQSPSIGSLPPSTSVYAANTPVTPVEPASAATTPQQESKSVVRLTTLPGEYRPGGTSTYRAAPATGNRY